MQQTQHTITDDEAALYDRQIRLWGIEAQHRMRNASILIVGIRGLSNEVCKNLVLAGIGTITILEHQVVTPKDLGAQFLLREADLGRNRAEAAAEKVRLLNPRVKVVVDTDKAEDKPDDYFTQFDLVCLTGMPPDQMVRINEACRRAQTGFYAASVGGFFGYIFCDLTRHEYLEEVKEGSSDKAQGPITKTFERVQEYDPLQATMTASWGRLGPKALRRVVSPLFFALQVLWKYQMSHDGQLPDTSNESDVLELQKLRDERLSDAQVDPSFVPDDLLVLLASSAEAEISPVCAIVGGFLAQDILKALSKKDSPIYNFFVYNGLEGNAVVHRAGPTVSAPHSS
ncbi:SUMO-activating enzyme subunit 1 [Actinomortierella ambigua]|nr:SUMO-activating enzyme subunit 1 [Actinomortierella ambigua]